VRKYWWAVLGCLAVLLLAGYIGMAALVQRLTTPPAPGRDYSIPAVALQGVARDARQLLWASEVGQGGYVLGVIEVTFPDGRRERRAFVNRAGQPAHYLGPLQRHFGDTPLETAFVEVGGTALIVSYVDPQLLRGVSSITLSPGNGASPDFARLGGFARYMVGYHGAVLEIRSGRDDWDSIGRIGLYDAVGTLLWERQYQSAVDTRAWWVSVP
jgi:hypothetical protein